MNNGMFAASPWVFFAFIFVGLVFWWYYRVVSLTEGFLKAARELLDATSAGRSRRGIFYQKEELRGSYKGRDVTVGIELAGFKGEFLVLPRIRMRLKDTLGYNLNRLPHYALVEKNHVVFHIKMSVFWGVFDRSYPQIFTRNYLVVALEKLLSTAEDLERGRSVRELMR